MIASGSEFANCRVSGRLPYERCKAITDSGNGDDELVLVFSFSQYSTQQENVLSEVALFDEAVGPHGRHQLVLAYDSAAALDQPEQNVKGFGGHRNGPAFTKKQASPGVDLKRLEFIEVVC